MKPEFKKYIMIGGLVILLLIVGYLIFARNKSIQQATDVEPTEEILPTVDSSVKVTLEGVSGNREVSLTVTNVPSGTDSVDYELSYQTASQGLQGVIGTVMTEGKSSIEKKLTLGTCSSGTCVYHQVVGKIKLTLKFSGEYGEKIFEKEYEI
ncbi:MAG: hypothetical protein US40_C0002G0134 [Candidatus Roizmanbacteria bacterium GW2011_GWC2_37_13]|uniref:Uncharacterized protein n=1 Tax=Candidatus Roizmanbacteria bacterium GW2011_GWC2_37_13 TaxID=1618486 RepID=A0A0G0GKE5_9BACT|nr:MAG: hypothetical protein US38_C0013G0015 [Candidatus Roizmanbacteria bacterium GW2011_GWC1_37_12]KKQ26600.1 MAG: hypothetical protein US40_C0002G0134 [Candidatus Roizmanbacteria bacterium GW2011_GWC2_37_13]